MYLCRGAEGSNQKKGNFYMHRCINKEKLLTEKQKKKSDGTIRNKNHYFISMSSSSNIVTVKHSVRLKFYSRHSSV